MAKRLINTTEKRGIDESKYTIETPDEDIEEIEDVENIPIKTPEELNEEIEKKDININEDDEYMKQAINETDENIAALLRYQAIGLKIKDGKKLSIEEKHFMNEMNELYAKEKEIEEKQNAKMVQNEEVKEIVMKEYEETKKLDPTKIDVVIDESKTRLRGSDSIPKLLKFALLMKKAKKKGGKILVKVTRDRQVILEWTLKELTFVEFWVKDEKGNMIPEVTRFNEYKYNYEGSPIPVLFAVQGYAEGFDFFDNFRQDITSEMVSRIASRSRHAGFLEGVRLQDKQQKKNTLESILPYLPIIITVMCIAMIYFLYMMYQDQTKMLEAIQQLQSAAQTIPMVVN